MNRVHQVLPSHRQDILVFLANYRPNSKTAADGLGPYKNLVPPTACGENSQTSTSAESTKAAAALTNPPLLSSDESRYLKLYGRELFDDMVENEYKS